MTTGIHMVTGAFGYTGRYIAEALLGQGRAVRTLTNSPQRINPFGARVEASPFHFDDPSRLRRALEGTEVLYNTYWVRFNHQGFSHALAVKNTKILFAAAAEAGVRRVVHTSITNPSLDSPLEYFAGKAELEQTLKASGLSYAILRPTVIFGREDILINNIAWFLRHFPVFGVFGRGRYKLQPIYVGDFARLAVSCGTSAGQDCVVDAIGPQTFSYRELARTIGRLIGCPRPVVPIPPGLGHWVGALVSKRKGDVTITPEEIKGLMSNLLWTSSPPVGETRLTDWVAANRDWLGTRYASELARRRDRLQPYDRL